LSDFHLTTVQQSLLQPSGLSDQSLMHVLEGMLKPGIDAADIFLQSSVSELWALEDGMVKDGSYAANRGFGLRAISGEKSGFAYSDAIDKNLIEHAASAASSIVKHLGASTKHILVHDVATPVLYQPNNPLLSLSDAAKIALLEKMDRLARAKDLRVKKVFISLSGEYDNVLVAHSSGIVSGDIRPLVNLRIEVIVEQDGRRERGSYAGGGRYDYKFFSEEIVEHYVSEAVRRALLNLDSESAPAGNFPVILGAGWPAVLLHEAIGHGLEGDSCRKGTSVFADLMGEQIASNICTVVDDGTLVNSRGSLAVDDEGVPGKCTTLIAEGKLVAFMQDRLSAALTGAELTGNGRRESYAHQPLVRMTNTYMLPGKSTRDEIIASMDRGLLAVDFSGGQVDTTSGQFVFTTSEAYWVENGKIAYPVKQATLIGDGASVLKGISMVGNDLAMDSGIGTCGKGGQSVPVSVGQPTIRVDGITIGGAKA
jgi:TldD protein